MMNNSLDWGGEDLNRDKLWQLVFILLINWENASRLKDGVPDICWTGEPKGPRSCLQPGPGLRTGPREEEKIRALCGENAQPPCPHPTLSPPGLCRDRWGRINLIWHLHGRSQRKPLGRCHRNVT